MNKWLKAFRLRTLPLAFSSVFIGSSLAHFFGHFNLIIFFLTVFTALFLQILSNLANDYGDFVKGTDNNERKGPDRALQSGQITKSQMLIAIILFSILSFTSGLSLLYFADLSFTQFGIFFLMGIIAIIAAIKYTVGKKAYGYSGFGDLFVFLFFGLVAVTGSYFLQTKSINALVLLPAAGFGLLSVGVLNINNMRDIENDRDNNKITIAVKLGLEKSKQYHFFLILLPILFYLFFTFLTFVKPVQWAFLLICPALIYNFLEVKKVKVSENFDPLLKQLAIASSIFSLTFCLGLLLS